MGVIRTVLGDIDAAALGWCECRSHLFIDPDIAHSAQDKRDGNNYDAVVTALMRYKDAGGGAILDGQTLGRGRLSDALVRASRQTGVPIIASTGFHLQAYYADRFMFALENVALEQLFINELTFGMVGKGQIYLGSHCAGIVKTAIDEGGILKNAISEKLFFAVLTFFSDHSISPDRMIFCHTDTDDPAVNEALANAGAYIAYDTGKGDAPVQRMLDKGYAQQLMLVSNAAYDTLLGAADDLVHRFQIDRETLGILMLRNPARVLQMRKPSK
jgi:phosphotriesterase-related protein